MDDCRGDRRGRARPDLERRALPALHFARGCRFRESGAVGDATRVRRASGKAGRGRFRWGRASKGPGRRSRGMTRLARPGTGSESGVSWPRDIAFLIDCDNTLLDNDRVQGDLRDHLAREFGADSRDRYWMIFEELRSELGYADYLGALQRYRLGDMNDPRLLLMSSYLVDYPFADRLYDGALAVLAHLHRFGPTVILTDGDVVFQPRKIQRSGLWDAVDGRVLIYIHKEQMLDAMKRHYPAHHYYMVDDKLRIL